MKSTAWLCSRHWRTVAQLVNGSVAVASPCRTGQPRRSRDWRCIVGYYAQIGLVGRARLSRRPDRGRFKLKPTALPPEYDAINVDRENGAEDHVILVANQTYSKLGAKSTAF